MAADAAAARIVLDRFKYNYQAQFNSYDINFDDGSHLELYAGGLHGTGKQFDGGMFALRGFSDAIGSFIFDFSRAAGCVMFPASESPCVLLPCADMAAHLPSELGEEFQRIPVGSGGELLAALKGGYDNWRAYRDQIVRASTGDPDSGAGRGRT